MKGSDLTEGVEEQVTLRSQSWGEKHSHDNLGTYLVELDREVICRMSMTGEKYKNGELDT